MEFSLDVGAILIAAATACYTYFEKRASRKRDEKRELLERFHKLVEAPVENIISEINDLIDELERWCGDPSPEKLKDLKFNSKKLLRKFSALINKLTHCSEFPVSPSWILLGDQQDIILDRFEGINASQPKGTVGHVINGLDSLIKQMHDRLQQIDNNVQTS